jgi:ribosome biogenesis protein ERB1
MMGTVAGLHLLASYRMSHIGTHVTHLTHTCRYDLDLGDKPYKALRYHAYAVRGTACHRTYPLFASSSDDGTAHVFHGMVYSDLMTNPLLVPLKVGLGSIST